MRIVSIFLPIILIFCACGSLKQVQKIQQPVQKSDTIKAAIETDDQTGDQVDNKRTDSAILAKNIINKVTNDQLDYSTFNAKVRVQYEDSAGGDEATAFIRLKKDSAIWVSLRGPLGIEGLRVFISKDSVKVMNLLKKNVQLRSIDYLSEMIGMPFDFTTLQNLVIGNPVFIDSNIISYSVNTNNELLILMEGNVVRHLITLNNKDHTVLHSKLEDINSDNNCTCDISFSDYENKLGKMFSTKRKISVTVQSKLDVHLDYKQYTFNASLTFPFNVPKNFKII